MKTQRKTYRPAALMIVIVTFVSLMGSSVHAQLNEKKVERDASGIYKGKATGGKVAVSYDETPEFNFSFPADPYSGKVKVPVKDGKLKTGVTDNDLPEDSKATLKGKEQKSKVTRGGKKIAVKAAGSGIGIDNDPHKGPWVGGKIAGGLTDKGSKWSADTSLGAYQRNGAPVPDHTKRVSGYKLRGTH